MLVGWEQRDMYFLISIFESKRHGEDLEYNDAGDDSEEDLVEDGNFVTTSIQDEEAV